LNNIVYESDEEVFKADEEGNNRYKATPQNLANDGQINDEKPYYMLGKVYKHYKGNRYKVLHVGIDTETSKTVIIYKRFEEVQ
jgi:hypothetical protein